MKKSSKTLLSAMFMFALLGQAAYAEDAAPESTQAPIKLEGYVDTYYAIDTDTSVYPQTLAKGNLNARPLNAIGFRKNEFGVNTAQLTASTTADWYRARMTIAYGTIPQQSWFPSEYLSLQEANAGFKIVDNLWIDGGLFLTHIGGESLLTNGACLKLL